LTWQSLFITLPALGWTRPVIAHPAHGCHRHHWPRAGMAGQNPHPRQTL
jgi:hypothetical protein